MKSHKNLKIVTFIDGEPSKAGLLLQGSTVLCFYDFSQEKNGKRKRRRKKKGQYGLHYSRGYNAAEEWGLIHAKNIKKKSFSEIVPNSPTIKVIKYQLVCNFMTSNVQRVIIFKGLYIIEFPPSRWGGELKSDSIIYTFVHFAVLSIKMWVKNHITVGFSALLCRVWVW